MQQSDHSFTSLSSSGSRAATLLRTEAALIADESFIHNQVRVTLRIGAMPKAFQPITRPSLGHFVGADTYVVGMEILVHEMSVAVPIHAFIGLSDPRSAEIIEEGQGKWVFELIGGEGASVYRASIFFDGTHVSSVLIYAPSRSSSPYVAKRFPEPELLAQ